MRPLCPTCWTIRTKSLSHPELFIFCLKLWVRYRQNTKMILEQNLKDLPKQRKSFDIYFALRLALVVFQTNRGMLTSCSKQNNHCCPTRKIASTTISQLTSLRFDVKFYTLYDKCVHQGEIIGDEQPHLQRQILKTKTIWWWLFIVIINSHHVQRVEFMDAAISSIIARFDKKIYDMSVGIENVLLDSPNTGVIPTDDVNTICEHFENDLQKDRLLRPLGTLYDLCGCKSKQVK